MGTVKYIYLGMALSSSALAQSAANFEAKAAAPAESQQKPAKAVKPDSQPVADVVAGVPSRYVGTAELEPYISSLVSVFQAQGRVKDPFGHYQDPDSKPVAPVLTQRLGPRPQTLAVPLADIVARLPITTIIPGEKSFLVENRRVRQGQEMPLVFQNKSIRVQVTTVSSSQIIFRDVDTGETGIRRMEMLPVGMSIGNGKETIVAPGMVPDRPNAPFELDAGEMTR